MSFKQEESDAVVFDRKRVAFHEHLDRCEQCARHPFGLCEEGRKLLTKTVTAAHGVIGT